MEDSMKKSLLLSVVFASYTAYAGEFLVPETSVFVPRRLASRASLTFSDQSFRLSLDGTEHVIETTNVRGLPILDRAIVEGFSKVGYFSINMLGEGYTLTACARLLGGMVPNQVLPGMVMRMLPPIDRGDLAEYVIGGAVVGGLRGGGVPGALMGAAGGVYEAYAWHAVKTVGRGPGMAVVAEKGREVFRDAFSVGSPSMVYPGVPGMMPGVGPYPGGPGGPGMMMPGYGGMGVPVAAHGMHHHGAPGGAGMMASGPSPHPHHGAPMGGRR